MGEIIKSKIRKKDKAMADEEEERGREYLCQSVFVCVCSVGNR